MSRAIWKPTFIDPNLWTVFRASATESSIATENEAICIKRSTPVLASIIGTRVYVANGVRVTPVIVTAEMVGHRFGEFSPTRKRAISQPVKTAKPSKKL